MSQVTLVLYGRPSDQEFLDFMRQVAPPEVVVVLVDTSLPLEQQAPQLKEADIIIPFRARVTMDVVKRCPRLKLIQVTSAGTDNLDKPALAEMGIRVANNGGGNAVAVAEHTIMMMVMAYRKAGQQILDTLGGRWSERIRGKYDLHEFHELTDKTVGIIGLGRIGQRVAARLQGWECKLLYYDILTFPRELERKLHVKRVELDELVKTSDVITLHVPLTARTRGMISQREFRMMKPDAILVNACRGPVVDEKALYEALVSHRILGAGIDVTEEEPTPTDNPHFKLDNVVVTPHVAGLSVESRWKSLGFAVENATRMARGEEPTSLVAVDE